MNLISHFLPIQNVWMNTYIYICWFMHVQVYMHIYICMNFYAFLCAYIRLPTYTVYIYSCMYVYICTCPYLVYTCGNKIRPCTFLFICYIYDIRYIYMLRKTTVFLGQIMPNPRHFLKCFNGGLWIKRHEDCVEHMREKLTGNLSQTFSHEQVFNYAGVSSSSGKVYMGSLGVPHLFKS